MKKRLVSLLLVLALAFTLVPSAFADVSDCFIAQCTCTGPCSYGITNYRYESPETHTYSIYCTGCGVGGGVVLAEEHTFRNGTCIYCGYTDICYHTSTYTTWNGCNWYTHCSNCGTFISSGVSHGATAYGSWQNYSTSQHRRYNYCVNCGQGEYEYGWHNTQTQYEQYSSSQHRITSYCSVCSSDIGSASYENHDFSYGSWQNYSDSRHRRTRTCRDCGYSSYDYADHADTNGDGLCDGCSKELTVYVDVTLDACGGVLDEDEVTVIFGDTYGELPEPTREGYEFDGWYTAETGGELVEAGTEVSDKAAHTLYAHWTLTKVFSVTVPAGLPLAVTEDGVVTSSTDAAIANNSTCDVRVTGISLKTENGWTLVPFTYNMAAAKVDSKLIGFAIGNVASTVEGNSESLALTGDWSIDAGAVLPLDYDANVSATSVGIDEQVLTVVFVVEEAA